MEVFYSSPYLRAVHTIQRLVDLCGKPVTQVMVSDFWKNTTMPDIYRMDWDRVDNMLQITRMWE